ncbi:hypothetical protein [Leptospira levettii]|uniref:hypothetical protein n=1 Tax=Leptospira levettii TaxID=2023178 RepID=UPI003EBD1035
MNKDKWYNSNWTIGLVCSSLLPIILTFIVDFIKKIPILSTLQSLITESIELIRYCLNYEVTIGNILLSFLFLFVFLIIFKYFYKSQSNEKPYFLEYNNDNIKSFYWTWDWVVDQNTGKYAISNLKPHCPKCNTNLIINQSLYRNPEYECPRCNFETQVDVNFKRKIEIIIIDNINRMKKEENK